MATPATAPAVHATGSLLDQKLAKSKPGKWGMILFLVMLVGGLFYIAKALSNDLSFVHQASIYPYFLLGIALFIALGFEGSEVTGKTGDNVVPIKMRAPLKRTRA